MTRHMMQVEGLEVALQERFGFSQFREGQREVIERLVGGESAVAVFPTGSGKSLCYQLPATLWEGVTLVVSPLIALMKDQIDALASRGIAACRLDSSLTSAQYVSVLERLRCGELRLLYVAPERFNNERFRELIRHVPVALFAIDEAHCISEWGHNFRPDYLKLADFARECAAQRVLALTATATPQVLADMCRALSIPPENATCTGFYRSNLTLLSTPVEANEQDNLLVARMSERPRGATIVYVTLQKTAERVATLLAGAGFDARAYHAGMDADVRHRTQEWFLGARNPVVVATIAFGMGIDKADIRYVYHYNLPKSLENYSQEIGRAGRDGLAAICEMLACPADLTVLENFAYGDTPSLQAVQKLVAAVINQPGPFDISLHDLSYECDMRTLVLRTMLTYLELDGYLQGGTPYYLTYRFKPLLGSSQILAQFEGERQTFLREVFRGAKKAKVWFELDVDQAARRVGCTRERIIRALDYLDERQMLQLSTQGARHRYTPGKKCTDPAALAEQLHAKALEREDRELARLAQVVELAAHDGCQTAMLCAHFGQTLAGPCGHCSACLSEPACRTSCSRTWQAPAAGLIEQVRDMERDYAALREPWNRARFLCGISSPQLIRQKLTRHRLFGQTETVPFTEVLALVS